MARARAFARWGGEEEKGGREGAREKVSGTPKEDTRERKRVDRGAENGDGGGQQAVG